MLDPDVSAMAEAYADVDDAILAMSEAGLSKTEMVEALRFAMPFADAAKATMWRRMRDECHSDEDVAQWVDDNPAWATVRDGVANMRRVLSVLEGSGDG